MTIYSFISTILSYVFTVIIYVFIIFVIRLIYLDVKKMSRFEDRSIEDEACASLRPIKSKVNLTSPLKRRYNIYGEAVIGRSRDCDIVINEKFVSQKHLIIWFENGEWYLEDLGQPQRNLRQRSTYPPGGYPGYGGHRFPGRAQLCF